MRTKAYKATQSVNNDIDYSSIHDALYAFIRDNTDVAWQAFLDEITVITGNSSMMDDAKEAQKRRGGRRLNGHRDALLPRAAVEARVGLKKTTIYELVSQKRFPAPVKIGKAARWKASEISRWVADRTGGAR